MIDAILKKIAGNQKILTIIAGAAGGILAGYGIEISPEGSVESLQGWAVFFGLMVAFGGAGGAKIAEEIVRRKTENAKKTETVNWTDGTSSSVPKDQQNQWDENPQNSQPKKETYNP